MGKMISKLFGMKEPVADADVTRMQAQERSDQNRRQVQLDGEKAGLEKALTSGRLGRQQLTFKPSGGAGAPKRETLG